MKLIFITDYIGRETAMKQYHKGDVGYFNHAQATEIIRLGGAVVEIEDEPPFIPEAPKVRRIKKRYYDTDA